MRDPSREFAFISSMLFTSFFNVFYMCFSKSVGVANQTIHPPPPKQALQICLQNIFLLFSKVVLEKTPKKIRALIG